MNKEWTRQPANCKIHGETEALSFSEWNETIVCAKCFRRFKGHDRALAIQKMWMSRCDAAGHSTFGHDFSSHRIIEQKMMAGNYKDRIYICCSKCNALAADICGWQWYGIDTGTTKDNVPDNYKTECPGDVKGE